jgi:hypothetical protein
MKGVGRDSQPDSFELAHAAGEAAHEKRTKTPTTLSRRVLTAKPELN